MEGHWNISSILDQLNSVLDPSSLQNKDQIAPVKHLGYYAG